ncbi:unnamed protein product [Brachionus calyciflorus]|uniref:Methyltransferase FkbM domain-containing protein n=1 Tax=Brachionus calyciflorus TaxID=104777 RepID=A0A813PBI1_9BILA|nr:unnamed protein product [Brachionus calyciflorus]
MNSNSRLFFFVITFLFSFLLLIIYVNNYSGFESKKIVNQQRPDEKNYAPRSKEVLQPTSVSLRCPSVNEIFLHDKAWSEIFNVSNHQSKIKPEIIIETIRFMIQEIDELDPKLIEFVKKLIDPPSDKPINLADMKLKDFSQSGQSIYIDELLGKMQNGFVVEAGALDGETFSNSLYFELERNWTGILIEPVPFLYEKILRKNRKMYSINACIARKRPLVAKFKIASSTTLSGRDSEMSDFHQNWVGKDFQYIYVPCFSLNTILKAINIDKVDFFSLDLEGGEWDVLSSLDFKNIDYRTFVIEHNRDKERREKMTNYLIQNNYNLTLTTELDIFFMKKN